MPFSFDKNEIKKSVRVILEKKTGIKSEIKENFSRVADSFYPMLYTELFKENYSGKESFSKAMSLYKFIKSDETFLNELFELNETNEEDDEVFDEKEENSEKEMDKKVSFLFKRKCEDKSVKGKSQEDV